MVVGNYLYLAVGETATFGNLKVTAVEDPYHSCLLCAFRGYKNCQGVLGECEGEYRPDGRDVVYLKVKEDECNK